MFDRGLVAGASHRAPARHAHHRDHDVWRRRVHRTPGQPLAVSLRFAAGDRRVYRVYPVEFPARQYRARRTPLGWSPGGWGSETGGFPAFTPGSSQPANTALGGRRWDEATAVEYLKVLAISRLYLSNFLNVQSSWVTQGLKVCQMGLRFGGNDVGSVMLEENVVRAAGVNNCTTEEELRRIIRDAAFRPAQRDTLSRQYFLN